MQPFDFEDVMGDFGYSLLRLLAFKLRFVEAYVVPRYCVIEAGCEALLGVAEAG